MSNHPAPEIVTGVSLVQAIDDATRHLLLGVREISSPDWRADIGQPGFSLLATGAEKLCKLTLMVDEEATTGTMPTDKKVGRGNLHAVEKLTTDVDRLVRGYIDESGNGYLRRWQAGVDADPYWLGLVALLDVAANANEGRYRHARAMSGTLPDTDSPAGLWEALDTRVAIEREVLGDLMEPVKRNAALALTRGRLLGSVVQWWHLMFRAWQQGAIGARGRSVASELGLDLDKLPEPLRMFVKGL